MDDDWHKDPQSNEAWCAGNNYMLEHLCRALKVDPKDVDWDGSDNGLDDETDALILRILHHNDDDDGRSPEVAALIREAEARGMERAAGILDVRADVALVDMGASAETVDALGAAADAIRAAAADIRSEATK